MTEEELVQYLATKIPNVYGLFGLLGNLYKESGLKSTNLQYTGNKALDMTDAQYTAAVDSGKYTPFKFSYDGYGYGLAQWTYHTRKEALLDFAHINGTSVGDTKMQCDFLVKELITSFPSVWRTLNTASSIQEASDAVLLKFESPANANSKKTERAECGQDLYNKYIQCLGPTPSEKEAKMSNSSLASVVKISPNRSSPRNHAIDTITIHCFVGQVTAARGCDVFQPASKKASCNYVIGKSGDVGLVVEEKDRSWCSSNAANDHRAVTIEVASDSTPPYQVTSKAYATLLDLCTDICKRNGKTKLLWFGSKSKTLAYKPAADEMVMTVHRWFSNKSCPGDYLFSRHAAIAAEVTRRLNPSGSVTNTAPTSAAKTTPNTSTQSKQGTSKPALKDPSLAGTYTVKAKGGLHLRSSAGTNGKSIALLSDGTKVKNYGYYTRVGTTKWLYIQVSLNGVTYTGFSSSRYLVK